MPFGRRGEYPILSSSTLSVSKHPVDRASIEEDYAKRLANLAEMALGRDEIGYVYIFPDSLHPEL